jgi:hypothetical protein
MYKNVSLCIKRLTYNVTNDNVTKLVRYKRIGLKSISSVEEVIDSLIEMKEGGVTSKSKSNISNSKSHSDIVSDGDSISIDITNSNLFYDGGIDFSSEA